MEISKEVFYSRQVLLPEIGEDGQRKLENSKVLVIGAGGLGCPCLQYLAASGVGEIGIIDGDNVSISNLHRQILFNINDVGKNKAYIASKKLVELNPFVKTTVFDRYLDFDNFYEISHDFDVIVDATDNFSTKYLISDVAFDSNIPVIYGTVNQFEGQVAVFGKAYKSFPLEGLNLRDLYPTPPPELLTENCAEAGVIGFVPGIIGCVQASLTIQMILDADKLDSESLLSFSIKKMTLEKFKLSKSNRNPLRKGEKFDRSAYSIEPIACGVSGLEYGKLESIDCLRNINKRKFQVIDVRTDEEHNEYPVGEVCIPLHKLFHQVDKIDRDRIVLFICKSGVRSKKAAIYGVNQLGIRCYSIPGGLEKL